MEKEAMKDEYEKQLENVKEGAVKALDSNNEHTMSLKMKIAQLTAKMDATEKELIDNQSRYREQIKLFNTATNNLNDKNKILSELEITSMNQNKEIEQLKNVINDKDDDIYKLKEEIKQIVATSNQK